MNFEELKHAIESGDKESYTVSDPIDDGKCPVCHGSGWEFLEDGSNTVKPCSFCKGGHDKKVADALIIADIPQGRSLSDFDWGLYNVETVRERRIVDQFVERYADFERKGLGLFLTSKTRGSGKTFLASAIGGELINRYETSIRFVSASNLIELSKEKRDDGSDPLDDLISCRVLILDDLGQQRTGRDWLTDILFRIIDKRYQARKTIIVTSNITLAELDFDDRIVDRLNRMTVTVKIPEVCIRAREANALKQEFLRELGIE